MGEEVGVKVSRKLCVFMDGTANNHQSQTNIRRLFELISAERSPETLCFYDVGVGAEDLKLSGMAFGAGFSKNVVQAYNFLSENYRGPKDEIYIFGFSRGARQAQVLCDLLDECGLPSDEVKAEYTVNDAGYVHAGRVLLREYKDHVSKRRGGGHSDLAAMREESGWKEVTVELVGIFDCVESMGNNVFRGLATGSLKDGVYHGHAQYTYDLPANVKEAYHAMALDEKRGLYEVIKWTLPRERRRYQKVEQVWFAGGHGDVGGGYQESQSLSAIPLNWMLSKLEKHDLVEDGFRVYADLRGPISNTREFGVGKALASFRSDRPRYEALWVDRVDPAEFPGSITRSKVGTIKPLVHESVYQRLAMARIPGAKKATLEEFGYRPWLLRCPKGFTFSYGNVTYPAYDYISGQIGKPGSTVDVARFRAKTTAVVTDRRKSEAGGFQK